MKQFPYLSKKLFKRALATALALTMLFSLVSKHSLTAEAEEKTNLITKDMSVTTNITASELSMKNLHDGDYATALWRTFDTESSSEPDYFEFTWTDAVTVNQVSLMTTQALKQGPLSWHVAVPAGENAWTEVARVVEAAWTGNGTETKTLTFEKQENIRRLRVYIDTSYNPWSGYSVAEIGAYYDAEATVDPMPEVSKNLASSAKLTVTGEGITEAVKKKLLAIKDGSDLTAFFRSGLTQDNSGAAGNVNDCFEFTWTDRLQ